VPVSSPTDHRNVRDWPNMFAVILGVDQQELTVLESGDPGPTGLLRVHITVRVGDPIRPAAHTNRMSAPATFRSRPSVPIGVAADDRLHP
jgi:hypothetical protein